MSVLITGAEGFVGHNLAELFSNEQYSVLSPRQDELDLTDFDSVGKYLNNYQVETIIHCATTLREGSSYPPNTCENNLRMFFNLQQHMTQSMKMINLGSGSEYTRKYWHKKMPEEYFGEHIPDDEHSYAKYLISKYIGDTDYENLICLRIFGIFGKYEDYRYKFISNAIVKNLLKMPIIINQNVIYDYICVQDFFRVVEFFVNNKTKNRIFNVTPTESIDLLTIAGHINNTSEHKSEIHVLNHGIGVEYSGNNQKILSEIGNFQFTPPEVSIRDLYGYYKERVDSLDAEAVKDDAYLGYAKKLHQEYFRRDNEK
jgi:UDP-glucose 4-epimerase